MVKPKNIGQLFTVWYSGETGTINRELIPVRLGFRQRAEVHTCQNGVVKVRNAKLNLRELGPVLTEHFKGENKMILGIQLIVEDQTCQRWLPEWGPKFLEDFAGVERNQQTGEALRNNGGSLAQIRFFDKLASMYEVSLSMETGVKTRATYALMRDEIQNFARGFDVWV